MIDWLRVFITDKHEQKTADANENRAAWYKKCEDLLTDVYPYFLPPRPP